MSRNARKWSAKVTKKTATNYGQCYPYCIFILEVGGGGPKDVCIIDPKTGVSDGVEDLVEEDVMIIDKRAKQKVEDEIIAHIEISLDVAHVVQRFNEIEFGYLYDFKHQNNNYNLLKRYA